MVCLLAAVCGRRRRATRSTDGPALIASASAGHASKPEPSKLCYFLGRETVLGHGSGEMGSLAEGIFGFLQRNAVSAEAAFNIASRQAIKMGIQVGHCCLRKSPPALASTARAAGDALLAAELQHPLLLAPNAFNAVELLELEKTARR